MWRWSVGGFLGKRDCSSRTKTTVPVARAPRSRTAHANFGAVQTFLVLGNHCGGVGEVDMKWKWQLKLARGHVNRCCVADSARV
jgi:hypothetical protein